MLSNARTTKNSMLTNHRLPGLTTHMPDGLAKPEVILTHESDLDGLVAGVLLKRLARAMFNADVPLVAYHTGEWASRKFHESTGWVADLSPDPRLDKPGWLVIDHHVLEYKPKHATLIHAPDKSASLLAYELCRQHGLGSPELDRLVHLTNVGDLFLQDDPDFVLACDYAALVKTYRFWNLILLLDWQIEKLLDHPLLQVIVTKRTIEDPIGRAWAVQNMVELAPGVAFADTLIGNANLIINEMLNDPNLPYSVLITLARLGDGAVTISIRSRNGMAIEIAKKLGGGGHPNAAGAQLPRSVRTMDDAITFLKRTLNPEARPKLNPVDNAFAALGLQPGNPTPQ